jgi:hypothetical protein
MRAVLLAILSLGCTAEVGEPVPERKIWTFAEPGEFEKHPFDPQHPSCIPSQEALDDWDADIERDLVGRFRVVDEWPGARLELFADGHYEWRWSGCMGTTLEVGIVSRFDDWVVLQSDICRWKWMHSESSGAFLLRDVDGTRVLIPADDIARFDADPEQVGGLLTSASD